MKKLVSLLLALTLVLTSVGAMAGSLVPYNPSAAPAEEAPADPAPAPEGPVFNLNEEDVAAITEPAEEPAAEPAEEPAAEPAEEPAAEPAEEPAEEPAAEPAEEPAAEPAEEPAAEQVDVLDFENGEISFLGLSMAKGNADKADLSVADYADSKALKIQANGKVPYVAFNLDGLLGERIADVRTISFDVGVDTAPDGKFYAVSGGIYTYTGTPDADLVETKYDWSVYLAKKNPKVATAALKEEALFVAGAGNYLVISKEVDNYNTKTGDTPLAVYVDNIAFLDAEGNPIPVDPAAEYVDVSAGKDLTNLFAITGAVDFPGFSVSGGAWSQNGVEMPQEIIDALVPGSVVEIDYKSADGNIWLVMPWASAGWMRVGNDGGALLNNSRTIAQITYEQIAALCGEDKSTWGAMMQCESSSDWEVYAVRVGQKAKQLVLTGAVDFPGFSVSGGAWSQNGVEMPQEIIDALVPGSAVEISFKSADGSMWLVMPWAAAGWMRVGNDGAATIVGDKAYVTYEQIAALCGEDKSTWGAMMQCEAASDWEVYAVRVGKLAEFDALSKVVEFPGFAVTGGAWSQNGIEMPQEIQDALVPGSVVTINYKSDDGKIWLVMPWAAAGWMRVGDGNNGSAVCDGTTAQIPYELIAQFCGEDKATWGAMMQCESSSNWEVYSLAVGQKAE